MRDERAEDAADGGGRALCATGVDTDEVVVVFMFDERAQGKTLLVGYLLLRQHPLVYKTERIRKPFCYRDAGFRYP